MKPLSAIVAILVLLGLGLCLWFWFSMDDPEPGLNGATGNSAEIDDRVRRSSGGEPATDRRERDPRMTDEEAKAEPTGLRLRCVEEVTGAPVPGVDVYVLAKGARPPMGKGNLVLTGDEMMRFGSPRRADESGLLTIARPENDSIIGGLTEGLFGSEDWNSKSTNSELQIRLRPRRFVSVKVVDPSGRALPDVVVELVGKTSSGLPGMTLQRARTADPSGIARIPLLALDRFARSASQATVRLDGLFEPSISADFDARTPPREPIVLVSPVTGSVRVRVLTAADRTPAPRELWFTVADASPRDGTLLQTEHRMLENNQATVTGLALGHRYVAKVESSPESLYLDRNIEFDGPRTAGEVVDVEVDLRGGPFREYLTGRLFDAVDVAAGDRGSISCRVSNESGAYIQTSVIPDATGRFSLAMEGRDAWNEIKMQLIETRFDRDEPRVITASATRSPGEGWDLGDLVWERAPVLAAGRVIDQDGRPIAGVQISDQSRNVAAFFGQAMGFARTDDGGRFELFGDSAEDEVDIVAHSKAHLPWSGKVARGATDLTIELEAAATVQVSFNIEDQDSARQLDLRVVRLDGLKPEAQLLGSLPRVALERSIVPGRVKLEVFHRLTRAVIWESGELLTEAGKTRDLGTVRLEFEAQTVTLHLVHPELGTLDLGSRAARLGESGSIDIEVGGRGYRRVRSDIPALAKEVVIEVEKLPTRARLRMPGYRAEILRLEGDSRTLQLKPGFPVAIEIDGVPRLPEGVQLTLDYELKTTEPDLVEYGNRYYVPGEAWIREFGASGRLAIGLRLLLSGDAGLVSEVDVGRFLSTRVLVVEDRAGRQDFRISLNTAVFEQALKELEGR